LLFRWPDQPATSTALPIGNRHSSIASIGNRFAADIICYILARCLCQRKLDSVSGSIDAVAARSPRQMAT